jgi:hypothetical protein
VPVCSGAVEVADIGIGSPRRRRALVEDADVARVPARPRQSHKWTTALGVAAGSVPAWRERHPVHPRRHGGRRRHDPARLAGKPDGGLAHRGGPGAAWGIERWAGAFLEATAKCRPSSSGPGLGTDAATTEEIRAVIAAVPVPLVIDADALTALGEWPGRGRSGSARTEPPHPHPPRRRVRAPGRAAARRRPPGRGARPGPGRTGAVVLLKGPLTAVAAPRRGPPTSCWRPPGVPALATAGTGDVLSGVIGAFLARGLPAHEAAALAAHVHGRAASGADPRAWWPGDLPDLVAAYLSSARARRGVRHG